MIFDILSEAFKIVSKKRKAAKLAAERVSVAKAFNNLYTYRHRWDTSKSTRLPGSGMWGFTPEVGHAWMCPDCNKIHLAEECSAMTGLQYPGCCITSKGHRLYHDIKTK